MPLCRLWGSKPRRWSKYDLQGRLLDCGYNSNCSSFEPKRLDLWLTTWNWQQDDWPHFCWDKDALAGVEAQFLHQSDILIGATKHFTEDNKNLLVVDLITGEAMKTSEIEGEYLNRDSVQSSILRNFGLDTDNRRVEPAVRGIADMMTDLYKTLINRLHIPRCMTGKKC